MCGFWYELNESYSCTILLLIIERDTLLQICIGKMSLYIKRQERDIYGLIIANICFLREAWWKTSSHDILQLRVWGIANLLSTEDSKSIRVIFYY